MRRTTSPGQACASDSDTALSLVSTSTAIEGYARAGNAQRGTRKRATSPNKSAIFGVIGLAAHCEAGERLRHVYKYVHGRSGAEAGLAA